MAFLPKVWALSGLALVSATQLAVGSPVMVWTVVPVPGMLMRRASCMNAEVSTALAQIS